MDPHSLHRGSQSCPMMTYDTPTGMISPLTLMKNYQTGAHYDVVTPTPHNHCSSISGVEDCPPQQPQHPENQQHRESFSSKQHRHYNRLKICQAREKIKRYFDNSRLLMKHDVVDDQEQHPCDVIPRFDIQELSLGKVLGVGGFGTVVEIKSINVSHMPQDPTTDDEDGMSSNLQARRGIETDEEKPKKRNSLGFLLSLRRDHNRLANDEARGGLSMSTMIKSGNNFDAMAALSRDSTESGEKDDESTSRQGFQPAAINFSFMNWRDSVAGEEGKDAVLQEEAEYLYCNSSSEPASSDTSNQLLMAQTGTNTLSDRRHARNRVYYQDTATRDGVSSYVIKIISPSIVENDFKLFLQAAIDMARETYFLSVLHHPNILTLRAVGQEDMFSPRYFLVLDRLHETLSEKIDVTWKKQLDYLENGIFHLHKSKKLESLWKERVKVMKDLAGALCYMHDLKIIYRDLKPDNIGFDSQGNVKLFDFGLAKEVREEDDCSNGTYKLTPNTGSIRYIAPENANNWPYNYLADCYSFGILLWEVTALERPYAYLTPKDIREMVLTWGERPTIKDGWSTRVVALMKRAWDAHYSKRPTMKEIESELELELMH